MNNAIMNICIEVFVWIYVLISLGQISRSGIVGFYAKLVCNFKKLPHYFPKWLGFIHLFDYTEYVLVARCGFNLHFLILKDVELPFYLLISHSYVFFVEVSVSVFCPAHFLLGSFVLLLNCKSSLYIRDTSSLSDL